MECELLTLCFGGTIFPKPIARVCACDIAKVPFHRLTIPHQALGLFQVIALASPVTGTSNIIVNPTPSRIADLEVLAARLTFTIPLRSQQSTLSTISRDWTDGRRTADGELYAQGLAICPL